jgi:LuxR family transcriptional regulator
MKEIERILSGTRKYGKKIQKLIEPAVQYFGVGSLTYIEQFYDESNTFINLSSNIPWIEHCMEHEYFKGDPHMVHPDNLGSGSAFWYSGKKNYETAPDYDSEIVSTLRKFNTHSAYSIIKKDKDSLKVFSFGIPKEATNFESKLCSNIPIMNKFVNYFASELASVRIDQEKYNASLHELKGDKFLSQGGVVKPVDKTKQNRISFLRKIGVLKSCYQNINLSKREVEIINLFLEGMSAKATAEQLVISRRTVESHFENIKAKLKVTLKSELFKVVKLLKEFELI